MGSKGEHSWIQCRSCGAKIDADFNAAYNISEKVPDWEKNPMRACKWMPAFSKAGEGHCFKKDNGRYDELPV